MFAGGAAWLKAYSAEFCGMKNRLEYLCIKLREARPGLPTHSFLMRRRALTFLIEKYERSTQSLP